jgi:hypothetical protein
MKVGTKVEPTELWTAELTVATMVAMKAGTKAEQKVGL